MKIVMNEAGDIVATHNDGFAVEAGMYAGFGPVIVGVVPDADITISEQGDFGLLPNISVLEVAKGLAEQMMLDQADEAATGVLAQYPTAEVQSWPLKLEEAKAIKAATLDPADSMFIGPIAEASGKAPTEVADDVISRANEYAKIAVAAEMKRVDMAKAIKAAKSVKTVVKAVS